MYGWFKVHAGNAEAVAMVTWGFTVTMNALLPVALTLSVAVTLKLYGVGVGTTGAVPLRVPVDDRLSHDGKFPLVQVTVPVPPDDSSV